MSRRNNKPANSYLIYGTLAFAGGIFAASYLYAPDFFNVRYNSPGTDSAAQAIAARAAPSPPPAPAHIPTPKSVKGIYMTSWVAGTSASRKKVVDIIDSTEINAVVIDIKDYTGRISFPVEDPLLRETGSSEKRIRDIKEFIGELHAKNIYVIGRISSFQDAYLVNRHPEWGVRRASDGGVWKDFKGISWLDVSAKPVWEYLVALGRESYNSGFDELNFDYIRFPSDGNMKDIAYPYSGGRKKSEALKDFFAYLSERLKDPKTYGQGTTTPAISGDFFGMTTTNKDDLNIGQLLENGLRYFDYISPMVYPSHYPPHFAGYDNPNHYPYEIVKYSMDGAVTRAIAASTTPLKLRPWLQDFDYGGNYDAAAVRKQIQATYDAGLDSWLLWSPSNVYTKEALEKEEKGG